MIGCSVNVCPYCNVGMCMKKFISINVNGQCMTWFDKHGNRKQSIDTGEERYGVYDAQEVEEDV